jgi:hypothetical protein
MSMESHGGMILTGELLRTGRKTCPSAILSTTNEMPATNSFSHGTVYGKPVTNYKKNIRSLCRNSFNWIQEQSSLIKLFGCHLITANNLQDSALKLRDTWSNIRDNARNSGVFVYLYFI